MRGQLDSRQGVHPGQGVACPTTAVVADDVGQIGPQRAGGLGVGAAGLVGEQSHHLDPALGPLLAPRRVG